MARKVAFVTGASNVTGKAIAIEFAKAGYDVGLSLIHISQEREADRTDPGGAGDRRAGAPACEPAVRRAGAACSDRARDGKRSGRDTGGRTDGCAGQRDGAGGSAHFPAAERARENGSNRDAQPGGGGRL